jgi:hypothetical protein
MRRSGHYEFGLDRRPLHAGDAAAVDEVRELWAAGREVEGWAAYWALVYGHVRDVLAASSEVRDAALVVRYEDLCARPREMVERVLRHCALPSSEVTEAAAATLSAPDYYRAPFDAAEAELIRQRTEPVARAFGYGVAASDRAAAAGPAAGDEEASDAASPPSPSSLSVNS